MDVLVGREAPVECSTLGQHLLLSVCVMGSDVERKQETQGEKIKKEKKSIQGTGSHGSKNYSH